MKTIQLLLLFLFPALLYAQPDKSKAQLQLQKELALFEYFQQQNVPINYEKLFAIDSVEGIEKEMKANLQKQLKESNSNDEIKSLQAIPILDFSVGILNYEYGDDVLPCLIKYNPRKSTLLDKYRACIVEFVSGAKQVYLEGQLYLDAAKSHWTNCMLEEFKDEPKENDKGYFFCPRLSTLGVIRDTQLLFYGKGAKMISVEKRIKDFYRSRLRFLDKKEEDLTFDIEKYRKDKAEAKKGYKIFRLARSIYIADTMKASIPLKYYYNNYRFHLYFGNKGKFESMSELLLKEIRNVLPNLSKDKCIRCRSEFASILERSISYNETVDNVRNSFQKILSQKEFTIWKEHVAAEELKWQLIREKVKRVERYNKMIWDLKIELGYERLSNYEIISNQYHDADEMVKVYYSDLKHYYR